MLKLRTFCSISLLILLYFYSFAAEPDCELVQYDLKCTIENGILFRDYLYIIQINRRAGEVNARISIPFSKENRITDLTGRIEDMNGKVIRELSRKDLSDISAVSDEVMYTDEFVRTFELIHNQYPYRIQYSYHMEYKEYLSIANWIPVLGENIPTHNASLIVDIPQDFPYKVKVNDVPLCRTESSGTTLRLIYEIANIPPYHSEKYAPSPLNSLPSVIIVPEHFKWFVDGSHTTWQTYGQWENKLIEEVGILPASEKSKVMYLLNGIQDKTEKVRRLYAYLQDNTRYVNVKIDVGGLRPYPAEYVVAHRYGDCKSLTNYMKALLGVANIASYYANIIADDNPVRTDISFPSQQFNHVILYVPLEKDTFFLECTNNTAPFGYVGTYIQNRPVFVVDGSNSHFVHTPALNPEAVKITRNMFFEILPGGFADVKAEFSFKGSSYELFNAVLTQLSTSRQEEFITEYIPAGNFDLTDWQLKRRHRDTAEIKLTATLKVSNAIKHYGNDISIQLFPISSTIFETPEKRKLPLVFNYPEFTSDSLVYELPEIYDKSGVINEISIKSRFGEYSGKVIQQNNLLIITRSLKLKQGEYALAEYPDLYKFITEFQQTDKKNIIIPKN